MVCSGRATQLAATDSPTFQTVAIDLLDQPSRQDANTMPCWLFHTAFS